MGFQKWLNNVASEDEKLLTKAAFTSLSHYLKMHSDHSMPVMIQHLAAFPVVGGFFTWAYKEQPTLAEGPGEEKPEAFEQKGFAPGYQILQILRVGSEPGNFEQSRKLHPEKARFGSEKGSGLGASLTKQGAGVR